MTAICLTGMHRSGTSLTASWLARCGLPIHDGHLIGAEHGNPRGHHEDGDFVDLHAEAVDTLQPAARGWQVFHRDPMRLFPAQLEQARQIIQARDTKYPVWGWKDPRSVLFLDQWAELIPDLRVLFIWRKAAPVVASLCRRARYTTNPTMRVSPAAASRLWRAYSYRILRWKLDHPDQAILVSFDDVMTGGDFVLDLMADRWGVTLSRVPIDTLIDTDLRRHRTTGLVEAWGRTAGRMTSSGRLERQLDAVTDRSRRSRG
jgi:O-antigen biosynthesis protein